MQWDSSGDSLEGSQPAFILQPKWLEPRKYFHQSISCNTKSSIVAEGKLCNFTPKCLTLFGFLIKKKIQNMSLGREKLLKRKKNPKPHHFYFSWASWLRGLVRRNDLMLSRQIKNSFLLPGVEMPELFAEKSSLYFSACVTLISSSPSPPLFFFLSSAPGTSLSAL